MAQAMDRRPVYLDGTAVGGETVAALDRGVNMVMYLFSKLPANSSVLSFPPRRCLRPRP